MAYNILKLKIKDKKLNYQKLAKELRISESGLNKKINGKIILHSWKYTK